MDFLVLRQDTQAFSTEQDREWYLLQSGQKENPELAAIYDRYPHLCAREQVDAAHQALAAAATPEEAARARHFLKFFVNQFTGNIQKERSEALQRVRLGLKVPWGDREVSYHYAQVLLANEPNRERRGDLSRRIEEVTVAHLNPLEEELVQETHRIARDLGYAGYVELWDRVKGLDLGGFLPLAQRFLAETADVARAALVADLDRYLGLDLSEAETHDQAFLNRANHFDPYFPKDALLPTLRRTLQGMGLNLDGQPNIHLDVEPREKKSPRAFCSPIRVPHEVVLVIMPRGGQDDYHSLFHEAGHAEHYGNVAAGVPFEFARLGDISVSEVYAFLFQHLLHDDLWLAEHLPITPEALQEYRHFALRKQVILVRRYCAKLRYELQLHRTDDLPPMAAVYARELLAGTFLPYRPAYYVTDLDAAFYSAQYLRAWMAEAQLRRTLRERFGRRWWARAEAGEFLRSLWAWGSRYNVVELVQLLGFSNLDPQPLVDEFTEGLNP